VSFGPSRQGRVEGAAKLPLEGKGFWTPSRWAQRGLRYGTDELVALVVYVGRDLARNAPGTKMSVADLSTKGGGRSRWHRSHQAGRDVDLLFVTKDEKGRPLLAERMLSFAEDGRARVTKGMAPVGEDPRPSVYFDEQANWVVVKSLLTSPVAEVQYIFVADWLKQRLIDHAMSAGEPDELIQLAGHLLHQPSDSMAHDDHFHVRVFCSPHDLALGCRDRGRLRWLKKDYKYRRKGRSLPEADQLTKALENAGPMLPVPLMLPGLT